MPQKVWLIPEGTTPYDESWPWKREILVFDGESPYEALRQVQDRGIIVEQFWNFTDFWVAGYDQSDALASSLAKADASGIDVEVRGESCRLSWKGHVWRGELKAALEAALGLEPSAGAALFFRRLGLENEHFTGA